MSAIYLVGTGEYSSYSIVGAFSSKVSADLAAKLMDGVVETFELDAIKPVDPGRDFFMVRMSREGATSGHGDGGNWYSADKRTRLGEDGKPHKQIVRLWTENDYHDVEYWKGHWILQWDGYADSVEHAVKICNEVRMQLLAGQRPEFVDMGKN